MLKLVDKFLFKVCDSIGVLNASGLLRFILLLSIITLCCAHQQQIEKA